MEIMMKAMRNAAMAVTVMMLAGMLPAVAQLKWDVAATYGTLAAKAGFDYITLDPASHRICLSREARTRW